jgi:hypothetical protein
MDKEAFGEFLAQAKNRRRLELGFLVCIAAVQLLAFLAQHIFFPHYADPFFHIPVGLVLIFCGALWQTFGLVLLLLPDKWWLLNIKINFIICTAAFPLLAHAYCHFCAPLFAPLTTLFTPAWIVAGIIALFCVSDQGWLAAIKWTTIFVAGALPVVLFLALTVIYPQVESFMAPLGKFSGNRHGFRLFQ